MDVNYGGSTGLSFIRSFRHIIFFIILVIAGTEGDCHVVLRIWPGI